MTEKLSQFTPQESGVKQFQSSEMQQTIQKTRETALQDTIAGIHYPETQTITYQPKDKTNPYEIQKEALSRINLLDESLNPTDTYTNYINKGNSPIPGMEQSHETLIFLDKVAEKEQEVQQGIITEDQMLWDLYGLDILAAEGYNMRSVAWWQNKYYNNDFTSPLDNRYLTSLVTDKARQEYNALVAKRYAQSQEIENSKLAAYTSGGDLSVKQVRELFPELTNYDLYKDDDEQLMQDISSGRINATLRIHTTPLGEQYYLHTDGRLYHLSNEGGENTASFKKDADGNITEININGSDVISTGRSFVAGVWSLFSGLTKLVMLPLGAMGIGTDETGIDGILDATSAVDAWSNDNIAWLADSGRVDLDGFQLNDASDWSHTIAYTAGMIVGGKAVGKIASAGFQWGSKLANSSNLAVKATGKTMQAASNLWARSTGMYQGFGPDIKGSFSVFGRVVYTGKNSMFLNHALKTVPTYMVKDFYQTLNQLQDQRMSLMLSQHINGEEVIDPTSDTEIFKRALDVTVVNGLISTVFAGGVDDSQTKRLQYLFEPRTVDPTKNMNIAASFFKALSSPRCVVAANTTMDFIDNFLTMSMNDYITVDKDGAHWTGEGFTASNLVRNIVTAGILTKPTYDANVERRNVGFESLVTVYQESLNTLDKTIRTSSDPETVAQAKATRDLLVNDFKQATKKDGSTDLTTEERALYALNKMHEATADPEGKSIITDRLFKLTDEKVLSIYKEMSDEAKEYYSYRLAKAEKDLKAIQQDGSKKTIKSRLKNLITSQLPTKVNLAKAVKDTMGRELTIEVELDETVDKYYNKYLNLVEFENAQEFEDKYSELSDMMDALDDTVEITFSLEGKEDRINTVVKNLADDIDIPEGRRQEVEDQLRSNMIFYRLKNEAVGETRKDLVIRRAAATNLSKLLPNNFVKIEDDIYAFTGLGTEIQQLFTQDVFVKTTLAAELISKNHYKEGVELYLSTALGDEDFEKALNKDKAALSSSKEVLYNFLQDMIDSQTITKLQAVRFIEELAGADITDIGYIMSEVIEKGTSVNHKNVNDVEQLNPIEAYLIRYKAFKILRENDSKLGNSSVQEAQRLLMDKYGNADLITKEVFTDMAQAGDLSNDFFKNYNDLIIAVAKKNESFQTTSNIERLLTDIAGDSSSTFDEDKIESVVSSILGNDVPKEARDELINNIKTAAQFIKDCKLVDAEMNGNKLIINTTLFTNASKSKLDSLLLNATTDENNNMIEKGSFPYDMDTLKGIKSYLELVDKATKEGKPYYILDLSTFDDIELLNSLNNLLKFTTHSLDTQEQIIEALTKGFIEEDAQSFIIYNHGKELASDIITDEEAAKISAYIYKDSLYKKKASDKVTVFYDDGTVKDIDLYTFISNCIGPTYISRAMKEREYIIADKDGNTTLGLNPFELQNTLKNNADVFQGTSLEEAIKTGRIGGEAAKKLKQIYSQGDYATVNRVLSTELMLLKYVEELSSSPEKTLYLDSKTYKKMVKAGIVDGKDSFYKTNTTYNRDVQHPKYYAIDLTATKEELEYYILHEEDFNLYKIIPLVSSEPLDTSNKFNFPGDFEIPDVTGGLNTVPRYPIYNVFNDTFEWDNGNKLRTDLLTGIIENKKGLKYNPLKGRKQVLDIKSVEEYKEYRAKGVIDNDTDIYSKLINLYAIQDEAYVGPDTKEDFKLWLADAETLKEIVDSSEALRALKLTDSAGYNAEKAKLAEKIISNYINRYIDVPSSPTNYTLNGITYNSFYGANGIMAGDYNTVISKNTLDSIRGIGYNFIDTSSGSPEIYKGAMEDITRAIDFVIDYDQAFLDDTFIASSTVTRNYTAYQPNDDILLKTLFAASDSKILIKDLDELYRIEAETYNRLFEAAMGKQGLEVARRVKSQIDNLYEQYLKLNNRHIKVFMDVNKEKEFKDYRTYGAATKQGAESIVETKGLVGNKKLGNYIRDNYIIKRESTPKADIARISDLMSDDVDSYEQLYYGNRDRFAKMHTNNSGQLEINNISRGMNAYKVANTIAKTSESLDKIFEEENISGVDTMALADQLHLQSDGTRYMSEWAKYNLYDPKTGKSELGSVGRNVHGSGKDHTDVLVLLDKPDNELIGKVFFDLEKHSGREQGGLNFKYFVIKDTSDINKLRTAALLDVFEDNKYNFNFDGGYSVDALKKLSPDKLLDIVNIAINNSVLRKNVNKRIVNTLREANISEENIYKILQDPEGYKTNYLSNNVKQLQGGTLVPALQSDNPVVKQQASLITYMLHYDLMDDNAQEIIKNARDMDEEAFINKYWTIPSDEVHIPYEELPMSKKLFYSEEEYNEMIKGESLRDYEMQKMLEDLNQIKALAKALDSYYEESSLDTINKVKEYFKDDPDGLAKMIEGYFVFNNTDAGVIYHRINKGNNLAEMYDIRHESRPVDDPIKLSFTTDKQDINELRNFFREDKSSAIKVIKGIDFETSFADRRAASIKDVWQIGIKTYIKQEDGSLKQELITKYVKHDGYMSTKEWAEDPRNVDLKSKFYKDNDSVRKSLKFYKSLQEGDPDLITEDEALKLLADTDMLIAYNGESFDFSLIKEDLDKINNNIKYLDAIELVKREQLDVRESAKLTDAYNGKRKFSQDFLGKAHNAEDDVSMMMDVFIEKLNSQFNLSKDKTSLVGKFELLADLKTPEDIVNFKRTLDDINTSIRSLQSESLFNRAFKQDVRTIDDVTYLARLFNHSINTARGKLFDDLSKSLSDNSIEAKLIEQNTYHEVNKVIAFVASTQGTDGNPDFSKALILLKRVANDIAEEDNKLPGKSHTLEVLSEPDDRLMKKLGLSMNAYEHKDEDESYKASYGLLLGTLAKGNRALLDPNNIFKVSPKDFQDYKSRGALDKIPFAIQAAMKDSSDIFKNNKELQQLWERAMAQPLTLNESFDPLDLLDYANDNIHYKDKQLNVLVEQLENLLDDDTVASIRTQSGYKMFNSFDTHPLQDYWELDLINGGSKLLDNVKAGDIVITKALLDKIVSYRGYEELLGDDGNLYLYTVSYPSDNPNSLMAHRIRVINDMGDGNANVMRFGFTPETQAILRARDFDGDFLSFFKPTSKSSIEIASAVNKYLYNSFNVLEDLASGLRMAGKRGQQILRYEAEALRLSTFDEVKEVCFKMDKALENNRLDLIDGYTEQLKTIIKNTTNIEGKDFSEETVEKITAYLGVVKKFNDKETVLFVNNPSIWSNVEGTDGYHSYSKRVEYYKLRAFYTSNILDSVTGYNQKLWSKERVDINDIKAPLVELYAPSVRLSDTIIDYIDTKLQSRITIDKYYDYFLNSIENTINGIDTVSSKWKNSMLDMFKTGLDQSKKEALNRISNKDPETQEFIKANTEHALHVLELEIRKNTSLNNKVLKLLQDDNLDGSYLEQLNRNKQTMALIKKIKHSKKSIRSIPKIDKSVEDIYLKSIINNQQDLARIQLNTGTYDEIPDLLEELKRTKGELKGIDINKHFLKDSSNVLSDNLTTANGFVFISDMSDKVTIDSDTIGVTNYTLLRSSSVGTFNGDLNHKYELPKDIIKAFNKSKNHDILIPAGTVIGYQTIKGSNYEEPITTKIPIHLVDIEYDSENKISSLAFYKEESLNDKKLKLANLAKGKAKFIDVDSFDIKYEGKNVGKAKIDFIITMENAVKNTDKFGLLPNIQRSFSKMKKASIVVNGKTIHGWLVPKVNAYVIGDDSKYSTMMNTDLDAKAGNRTEVMLLGGQALNLTGIGGITGKAVVFKNEDGTINVSNRNIAELYEDSKNKGTILYKNVADIVLLTRAQLLMDELGDAGIASVSNGAFKTTKEYMDNLMSSPAKLNSRRMAMELLLIQKALGSERVNKVRNKNSMAKAVFDPYLDEFVFYKLMPTSMTMSDNIEKDKIGSGNSQVIMAQQNAKYMFGENINKAETGLNKNNLGQMEKFYIPWNWLFKNIAGYEPGQNDIIKGTYGGYFSYGRHLDDGGTFNNRWMPVDVNRAYKNNKIAMDTFIANGIKSAVEGSTDRPTTYGIPSEFVVGEGNYNILNDYNNPLDPTVITMIGKALNNEQVYGDYNSSRQILSLLDYLTNVNASQNRNRLTKLASIRGTKNVDYALFNMGYRSVNNELIKMGDISIDESPVKNATKDINSHAKKFWTYKDLIDQFEKANVTEETLKGMLNSEVYEDAVNLEKEKKKFRREKSLLTKRLFETLKKEDLTSDINNKQGKISLTTNYKPTTETFESSMWSRSGIKVTGAETGLVDMAIKNCGAYGEYYKQNMKNQLGELKSLVSEIHIQDFTDYAMYNMLRSAETTDTPEMFKTRLEYCGMTLEEYKGTEKYNEYKNFIHNNPKVVAAYDSFINNMVNLYEQASTNLGEPMGPTYMFFAPYVLKEKTQSNATIKNTIHNIGTLSNFDPVKAGDMLKQNLMFNFFEGSEKIINEIGKLAAMDEMSKVLTGQNPDSTAMIDNVSILDKAFEILNSKDLVDKVYAGKDTDVTPDILNIISLYTDLDYYTASKKIKNPGIILAEAFKDITKQVEEARTLYTKETGEYKSLSDVYSDANNTQLNQDVRAEAQELYNKMWAQIILAQRIMEVDGSAMNKFADYIDSLSSNGKVLVNKFGQIISRDTYIKPLMNSSLRYLKDNVELSLNNMNKNVFAQFVMEKALSGEIYLADASLAKQLESNLYTAKVGSRVQQTLKKISSISAGIQMSLPTKMIGRLLRFTGFDYVLDAIANPRSIPYMSIAAKEISQAMQTNGKVMSDNLREYLKREGQPSIGQGSNKDPINYTEEMAITDFTNKLTRPLEIQNHLGRYAIYLTAKESFENGTPWYGPLYGRKEAVDALPTPEDKAMYIMDYLLGSPGGFPAITKKTAGWMMYSTFPMNLTRTMGAYGMSLSRLFKEGITAENKRYIMDTAIIPSAMAVGISYLGAAIISAICDMYNVDEETEEEWKKEGVWIDPIGTLIGGTPSVVYDSINPVYNLKEMYINPFTNEYNDTLPKKTYGWVQSNFLSKLNPAIKTPTEILLRRDLYGDSIDNYSRYQYTNLENGMRKVLGFFVGSGVANSIIDERKMSSYSNNRSFAGDLWKGITKGISADLGNQKSYKQNTSNYYAVINNIRQYKNASNGKNALYDYEVSDLLDASDLYYSRNYTYKYGVYNEDDYKRINNLLRKMIKDNRSASEIYSLIVTEFNNGISEATLRAVLNSNSIIRKLNSSGFNKTAYFNSLSDKEKVRLRKAIEYEMAMYPLLSKFFPEEEKKSYSTYIPRYQKIYNSGGSYGSSSSPNYYTPRYYPGRYYPKTFYYNRKVGGYTGANIGGPSVNVSPQMGIWNSDYNLTPYETGLYSDNNPKWLRDRGYISRVN